MALGELGSDFTAALTSVNASVTGENSIYKKTLTELNTLYTQMGLSSKERVQILAEVTAQLSISTTNAAIAAAVDLAKAAPLLAEQVKTEQARAAQIARQTTAFNDKLKVEAMKSMTGIAQMEATAGEAQATTLLTANKTINLVYKAAGISDNVLNETV